MWWSAAGKKRNQGEKMKRRDFIKTGAGAFFIAAAVTAFEAASLYKSYGKANRDSSYLPDKKTRGSVLRAFSESVFSPAFLIAAVIFVVVSYLI